MTPEEEGRLSDVAQADPEAYDLYLRGFSFGGTLTREGLEKELDYMKRAIAIDPAFARAYA